MSNTYTSFHYHIIFSTKNREPWISVDIQEKLWAYLGGILRENGMFPIQIGGVEDHVHALLSAPAVIAPCKAAQVLKGGSSFWIHKTFPDMQGFGWQKGYGAFTVSKSNVPEVVAYIQKQREHYSMRSFKDEYITFLQRHGIEYDEKYLWD